MLLDYLPLFGRKKSGSRWGSNEPTPALEIHYGRASSTLFYSSSVTASKETDGVVLSTIRISSTVAGAQDITEAKRRDDLILAL